MNDAKALLESIARNYGSRPVAGESELIQSLTPTKHLPVLG